MALPLVGHESVGDGGGVVRLNHRVTRRQNGSMWALIVAAVCAGLFADGERGGESALELRSRPMSGNATTMMY